MLNFKFFSQWVGAWIGRYTSQGLKKNRNTYPQLFLYSTLFIILHINFALTQKWKKIAKTYMASVAPSSPLVIQTWEAWGWFLFTLIPKLRFIPKLVSLLRRWLKQTVPALSLEYAFLQEGLGKAGSTVHGVAKSQTWLSNLTGLLVQFNSVQSLSRVQLFVTPWTAAHQASLSITNSWSLLKLMCIESVMPSNHLILCHPLLLLPSVILSIRVFSKESALHIRWPKYLSFSINISPSNEYSGLISFRIDWFDLLAIQGTLKSLLQCHSSKQSILRHSAFFIVQLTSIHDHWKNHSFD